MQKYKWGKIFRVPLDILFKYFQSNLVHFNVKSLKKKKKEENKGKKISSVVKRAKADDIWKDSIIFSIESNAKDPDFSRPVILQTFCDISGGSIHLLKDKDVCCMSVIFKPHPRGYCTIEKKRQRKSHSAIEAYCKHNFPTFVTQKEYRNQHLTRYCLAFLPLNCRKDKDKDNVIADILWSLE